MSLTFQLIFQLTEVIPNSYPESSGVEMTLTSCPGINLAAIDPGTQCLGCGSTVHLGKASIIDLNRRSVLA